jgi:hypothetical protein
VGDLELPEGLGVAVDPQDPEGLVLAPDQVAALRPLAEPFPVGTRSDFKQWPLVPRDVRDAIVAAAERYAFVERVWALIYTIDDSPWIGLVVYDAAEAARPASRSSTRWRARSRRPRPWRSSRSRSSGSSRAPSWTPG